MRRLLGSRARAGALGALGALVVTAALVGVQPIGATTNAPGTVQLSPTVTTAAAPTTLTLTYTADRRASFSGALRFDVPDGFSVPQTASKSAPSYLRVASSSCANASIVSVAPQSVGTRITLAVACAQRQRVKLIWTHAVVPATAAAYTVVASAQTGTIFSPFSEQPVLTVMAAKATHLQLDAPASVPAGVPMTLGVSARDAFGNVVGDFTRSIDFSDSAARASLPADYRFTSGRRAAADNGSHSFVNGATLEQFGPNVLTVATTDTPVLTGSANVDVGPPTTASTLSISPGETTLAAGQSKTFVASLGATDVTAKSTFVISPDGTCTGATCTPASFGAHLVTATLGSNVASAAVYATAPCTTTWAVPGTSGAWLTASNWSNNAVPSTSDIVCLPNGAYNVTIAGTAQAKGIVIGHGATLALVHAPNSTVLNAPGSIIDHGTLLFDGTGDGFFVAASGPIGIASDGAMRATGSDTFDVDFAVINSGSVVVDASSTVQWGCASLPCGTARWTNLAGSSTVLNGMVLVSGNGTTVDHQHGASMTVGVTATFPNLFIGQPDFGSNPVEPAFVDDGGSITGEVAISGARLNLNAGSSGRFFVQGLVDLSGTLAQGQTMLSGDTPRLRPHSGTFLQPTSFVNNGLISLGDAASSNIAVVGDFTNGATGGVWVGYGSTVFAGNFANFGSVVVANGATMQYRNHADGSPSTWTNESGSHTDVFGHLTADTPITIDHRHGAALTVSDTPTAELLVGSAAGSGIVPTFISDGGTIGGTIDVAHAKLRLNEGGQFNSALFNVHSLVEVDGTVAPNQALRAGSATDSLGNTYSSTVIATTALLSQGGIHVYGAVTLAGNLTNDGVVESEAGSTLQITGNYSQGPSGLFQTLIASASKFGQLNVTGSVALSGGVQATLSNYAPQPGDNLRILVGARNGTQFTTIAASGYSVDYSNPNEVDLKK